MSADDRTVLITGAAARIGAAIAERFHAAGCHVVLHYRGSVEAAEVLADRLQQARPDSVSLIQADLADTAALPDLIEQAAAATGYLDVLVNNASSYYPTRLGEITEDHWEDLFASNAKAPLFLSQAAAPYLREREGAIVNLVDIHAERPQKDHTAYCMAKAANAMLVKSLARELAPQVRVNGVAPGAILWPEDYYSDTERQAILKRIPLGRPGEADEIASAVYHLAMEAPYVTGQILAVDGGRSVQQ